MKAVMARILGRAGSGGALRWARAGEVRIKTEQSTTQKRSVPRRIGYLQTGRSIAAPLQDTGFGCGSGADLEKLVQNQRSLPRRYKEQLYEGGDAGYALADDEFVDVVGAFVGGDAFEIVHVAHDGVIVDDAVGAENVAGFARGFEGDGDVIHLEHGNVRVIDFVLIFQPPDVQREQLAFADFGNHPGELVLHELVRRDGLVGELLARFCVLQRSVVAGHGGAERAPTNSVAGLIQAAERAL